VPNDAEINATVSGGNVGLVGARFVRIENLYVGGAPAPTPERPTRSATIIPPSPYKGLAYFGPQDAGRFFGREKAIQALVAAVAKRSFTAVVGASGSGKSSVVLAGLAPRLETEGGWRSTYFRIGTEPDKNPFAALARALSPLLGNDDVVDRMTRAQKLANSLANGEISLVYAIGQCRAANPGKRILLIADQFEEVFTLVSDDGVRNRFIDALIAAFQDAAQGAAPDVCLVLTLRADFVSQAISYRALADQLRDRVEYLGPMTRDELREAIVRPVEAVQVAFEPSLVNKILDDVEKRPGSLPLLQFALREMWGRLKTPLMTRVDYDAIGGVEGALAKRAQAIFDGATDQGKDEAAVAQFRRLFTRLVTLGEGSEDTRRIVGRAELGPNAWALAQKLANEDNRLVVTAAPTLGQVGQETAEVVHEALIRNWPALVEWVNLDRAFQSWLRQLKPRVDEWLDNKSDEGTLLRGGPLRLANEWSKSRVAELNTIELEYIEASLSVTTINTRSEIDKLAERTWLPVIIGVGVPVYVYFSGLTPLSPRAFALISATIGIAFLLGLFVRDYFANISRLSILIYSQSLFSLYLVIITWIYFMCYHEVYLNVCEREELIYEQTLWYISAFIFGLVIGIVVALQNKRLRSLQATILD
jgi:hypothetical protein